MPGVAFATLVFPNQVLNNHRSAVVTYELLGHVCDGEQTVPIFTWVNTGSAPNVQLLWTASGRVVTAWAMGVALSTGSPYNSGDTIILTPWLIGTPSVPLVALSKTFTFL